VNLERSEKEVARYTPLFNEKLISEDIYELSLRTRDAFKAEVDAKDAAAKEIEHRLTQLSNLGVPENASTNSAANPLLAHLEALKASALTNLEPITLTAPMDGMVHFIHRRAGESVIAGEPLINISPLQSERIVAYLRQPYPVDLEVGMAVEVRTRERRQRTFHSEVVQIGARLEAITNALAFVRPNTLVDAGLPFVVRLPDDFQLRPGEMVDLMIKSPQPALSLDFKGGSGGGSEGGTALSTLVPK
jgi:multidrug resistance efflux pump